MLRPLEDELLNVFAELLDFCRSAGRDDRRSEAVCDDTREAPNLEVNEARRLRQLDHENGRLKRLVADLTLDNQALKELVGKKA